MNGCGYDYVHHSEIFLLTALSGRSQLSSAVNGPGYMEGKKRAREGAVSGGGDSKDVGRGKKRRSAEAGGKKAGRMDAKRSVGKAPDCRGGRSSLERFGFVKKTLPAL